MKFGRYNPIAQLGAGPDGIRFLADDPVNRSRVEIRMLGPSCDDPDRWRAMVKRLRLVELLDHPTSIRVIEVSPATKPPFVVMEHVEGRSLAEHHHSAGWDRTEAVTVLIELAKGLVAGHKLGLIHGRLTPSSVVIDATWVPRLDWTRLEVGAGAPDPLNLDEACRPPEASAKGEDLDPASDLFGLGVIMVWMLTGALPWESEVRLGEPSLDLLAKRLLALDPLERPSARDAAMSLEVWRSIAAAGPTADVDSGGITQDSKGDLIPPVRQRADRPLEEPAIERTRLGRFQLYEKLGQGGMGSVYRAIDLSDGNEVAIKLLSPSWAKRPESLKRFLKEARLLAEVNSPHVTNFIEVNEDEGLHYLAIEYVRGTNLADWIARKGRLDEHAALTIMADVARALAVAHERSVIHRDVKPENILLIDDGTNDPSSKPLVKLSDFGLARHVVENESLEMTQAGAILGTPLYMAPEQCAGEAIDARTDVYAMGATLFHLLAGRPPFLGASPLAVISMHRNEPPPALQGINPDVSDGVSHIVMKALAKPPAQRYSDAAAILLDLERLLRGEPTGIEVHPRLPESDAKDLVQFDWRFDLDASPMQLWPHVSNTNRINRAVGIPAVKFTVEPAPEGGSESFGEFQKMGMTVAWREHPFEWVEGRRMGVLREYTDGPFRWFVSVVELAAKSGGGTTLHHRVQVSTRGLLGRTVAAVEIGIKGKRAVEAVYRRIDASVLGRLGRDGALDPFEAPTPLNRDRRLKLDNWLESLSLAGLDPSVVERFGEFLAHAPAQEVARIRPLALARRLEVDPIDMVTACLLGAKDGVLVLLWDLLCPICRIPSQVIDTLRALKDHGNCAACQIDFELDFANSVELIFRVHPEIRPTDVAVYCVGGPANSPHVAAQARIAPKETVEIDLNLNEGHYRFRGPQLPFSIDFRVEPKAPIDRWSLNLSHPPGPELPRVLRAGGQVVSLLNDLDREVVVRIERIAPREDALTAGRASTLALFRELFPGELLEPGQLVNLATATFVVTDLEGANTLYDRVGDAKAFAVIHEHFRRVDSIIRREGGALIKTVDAGVFAAFTDPLAAVQAALALRESESPGAMTLAEGLALRVGVHKGPAMVATLNDHLDYFGTTVRAASALPEFCLPGEVVLSEVVAWEPRVAEYLQSMRIQSDLVVAEVQGLREPYLVRLVRPDGSSPQRPLVETGTSDSRKISLSAD
jgi:serine/threonine protein kinase/class 3 adenylate cyclase